MATQNKELELNDIITKIREPKSVLTLDNGGEAAEQRNESLLKYLLEIEEYSTPASPRRHRRGRPREREGHQSLQPRSRRLDEGSEQEAPADRHRQGRSVRLQGQQDLFEER